MTRKIKKAVFPVAGLGTRFLPATKAVPKEMLTIVDRPVIQLAVDEAREAGIEHLIFVTGRNKGVIEDHFDKQYELEDTLRRRNKIAELEVLEADLPGAGQASFTRQQEPLGLGHAVYKVDDPRALILAPMSKVVGERYGDTKWYEMSALLEKVAKEEFKKRKGRDIYTNVDFYSGIVMSAMGIPLNMFTVMFAIGRLPGWIAQWKESMDDPKWKLHRPRQVYTGPNERDYVPLEERE